jgi:hypothetical protein
MFTRLLQTHFSSGSESIFRTYNIYDNLKRNNIDTKSWMEVYYILDVNEASLYKKVTLNIIKDSSSHEEKIKCINSLINIITEIRKTCENDNKHCYSFLSDIDKFSSLKQRLSYITLYNKALLMS